jgi:hypothetical protein
MNRSFLEVEARDFKPMSVPGLEKEVRDAVNAALKAMSTWRNEIADTNEHNGKRVIEKMAAAAAALGWPEQIVMPLGYRCRASLKCRYERWIK